MRYLVKFIKTKSRVVVSKGCGEQGMKSYGLMGTEFHFYKMKRALELSGGNGCITMSMYLMPQNCTLKNG